MSYCGKSMNTLEILFLLCYTTSILMLFNNCWSFELRMAKIQLFRFVLWLQRQHSAFSPVTEQLLHLSIKTSSKWKVQEGLPLEPYFWRQHSSANSSPKQRCCRALSRLLALPVLPMALLLPTRRPPLASPVAAEIKINLFVLDQVCPVAATNALLSNALCARRLQAGQQGAGGPAGRRQEKSSCTSYVLRHTSMYKYVPSQSGHWQKISCKSIYRHVLSTYEYMLYLRISYWDIRTYTEIQV